MEPHSQIYNYLSPFLVGLLLSAGIGLIVGLEREYNKIKNGTISGIRTFPIVCVAGFLLGNLTEEFSNWIVVGAIPAFILFLGTDHLKKGDNALRGHTTHVALFSVFLLGMLVAAHLYKEALATAVVITTLLALKGKFKNTLERITEAELFATIKFFVLSLLILPFLPNKTFGPEGILNLYEIGWVVVIVSVLNFIGYFLIKFAGSKKGIMATAVLGGLFSSTAVAWSFSTRSKENPALSKTYAAGILIASSIMFPRLLIIVYIFNAAIVGTLWLPFLIMFLVACVFSFWVAKNSKADDTNGTILSVGNPLDVISALSFALIFILILLTVYYSKLFFGDQGLFLSALISGLADTDAISISVAKLANELDMLSTATLIIVTATLSNSLVKMGIGILKGSHDLRRSLMIGYGGVLLSGILYITVLYFK